MINSTTSFSVSGSIGTPINEIRRARRLRLSMPAALGISRGAVGGNSAPRKSFGDPDCNRDDGTAPLRAHLAYSEPFVCRLLSIIAVSLAPEAFIWRGFLTSALLIAVSREHPAAAESGREFRPPPS